MQCAHMHIDLRQLNGIAVVIRTCAYNVKRELRGVLPGVPLYLVIHRYIFIFITRYILYITHTHIRVH